MSKGQLVHEDTRTVMGGPKAAGESKSTIENAQTCFIRDLRVFHQFPRITTSLLLRALLLHRRRQTRSASTALAPHHILTRDPRRGSMGCAELE